MSAPTNLTEERIATIINHVGEEWLDRGETNFATKHELCAVILELQERCGTLSMQLRAEKSDRILAEMDELIALAKVIKP